jgi:hypothetical protein
MQHIASRLTFKQIKTCAARRKVQGFSASASAAAGGKPWKKLPFSGQCNVRQSVPMLSAMLNAASVLTERRFRKPNFLTYKNNNRHTQSKQQHSHSHSHLCLYIHHPSTHSLNELCRLIEWLTTFFGSAMRDDCRDILGLNYELSVVSFLISSRLHPLLNPEIIWIAVWVGKAWTWALDQ